MSGQAGQSAEYLHNRGMIQKVKDVIENRPCWQDYYVFCSDKENVEYAGQ